MIKIALKNIRLLEKISKIPVLKHFFILKISENFPEIKSELVLNKFYGDIWVNDKTSKKTEKNRFSDLNIPSFELMKENKNCIIHDIAVSNGISSNDFNKFLLKKKKKHEFYISDKFAEIKIKKGFITKAYDNENNLIFAYAGCFYAADKNIFFPLTVLLFKLIQKTEVPEKFDYNLLLLHPEVLKKMKKNEIKFINCDVFKTDISEKFTFVRAMNILNLGYFNEKKIETAVVNIKKSMKENAVLLVGRTNAKKINNASFFRKQNNKLVHLKDINEGSEIKNIILNL